MIYPSVAVDRHPYTFGLFSPSDQLTPSRLKSVHDNVNALEQAGHEVVPAPHALRYTPGRRWLSVQERIDDLKWLLRAADVDVLITTWGGTGCNQLLDFLPYEWFSRHPKPIVGDSDVSVLLSAISSRCDLVTFHGRGVGKVQHATNPKWERLSEVPKPTQPLLSGCVIVGKPGVRRSGVLLGGDLRSLCMAPLPRLLRDDYEYALFVESPHDYTTVVQLFTCLQNADVIERVSCVICGQFACLEDGLVRGVHELRRDVPALGTIPIFAGADFGHSIGANSLIPIGMRVTMEHTADSWQAVVYTG